MLYNKCYSSKNAMSCAIIDTSNNVGRGAEKSGAAALTRQMAKLKFAQRLQAQFGEGQKM
jgi:hypothetical protein